MTLPLEPTAERHFSVFADFLIFLFYSDTETRHHCSWTQTWRGRSPLPLGLGRGNKAECDEAQELMLAIRTHPHIEPALTHRSQRSRGDLQMSVGKPAVGAGSSERQDMVMLLEHLLGDG